MTDALVRAESGSVGEGRGLERAGLLAFWIAMAAFAAASIALARANNAPGSADSCGNLVLARNLILGRGYVSTGVGQLWAPQPMGSPETTRPPGLPYLLAAIFAASGVSLAVPVLVNALAVAANALLLRWAVARSGHRWLGDLAGLLVLLSYDYEMVSIWNNNILAACHSALLLMMTKRGGARRGPWLAVGLGACSAFGFLMKPTFLLGAVPFSVLVLGSDGGQSRSRRLAEVALCLGLFLGLTSVYWGRNLYLFGAPMYSPAFSSSRLAMRYEVLGEDSYRAVRFGRPMTLGEVAGRLGWSGLLVVDAKMLAKTVFYSIVMNPAVAALAAGLLVFWRRDRWREYAGVALLMAAVGFEVGVYNHHEFRYLWPIYPCLVYLAGLTVREFGEWGSAQMSPLLAGRCRRFLAVLGASAVLIGGFGSLMSWQQAFRTAKQPAPAWREAVARLPESAVVLTSDVPSVAWWTDRMAVICPSGSRDDLATVVGLYQVDHYLDLGGERPERGLALAPDDLTELGRGKGWTLYRIARPIR